MTHQDPHSHSADAVHDHHAVEAQYVRQGRSGRRTLVILLLSAGAAAVLLIGMWAVSNTGFQRQDGASEPAPVEAAAEAPAAALADNAT
ncbi:MULTISPECIES: hypothetical protein [unclassified Brevundimonas]|uniref:hypothetical protein n=1 Tax=unclassified Brevundimonas TaxID=2622653 RepID=UPI000E9E938F|nr:MULTISPECIES: hypothetical protein [unclassified Brevundimonas]HBY44573.1 hypothetical protein [Brevundimonas sp.]